MLAPGRKVNMWSPPLAVFALVMAGWYGVSYLLLEPDRRFLLPPPHAVVLVAFVNRTNLVELLDALLLSAAVAGAGLAIAVVIGMTTAIVMSQADWVERSIYPYFVVLQTIPVLALVPLFGFWFGFGVSCRVLVCVLIALFPIVANTLFGLRSVEEAYHDLFTLHRANRLTRLAKLQLPAALPSIFTGLRISAGLAVIGSIVGDFFFKQGDPGIGILIDIYRQRLQSEQLFAAVILSSLLGVLVFTACGWLSRRVIGGWHPSVTENNAGIMRRWT
jgi:NitT/TauT family transport system permease protein